MPEAADVRAVVVGAGLGGLAAARSLRAAGVDVVVLERGPGIGGVWRDNTYPGAACDVPSSLYSYSWAPHPGWSRRFAGQAEILDYVRDTAAREELLALVRTGVAVTSLVLDEATGRWRVGTAAGEDLEADLVVCATGQLSEPVVPEVPGAATFSGPAFHSARWRHDVDLRGRRVGVVGTGASAAQLVPGIVDEVAALTVFQRSAAYVLPRPDPKRSATDGGRARGRRRPGRLGRRATFEVTERLNAALGGQPPWGRALLAALHGVWRVHLRRAVPDPALRARLVPGYPIGCRRILFSDDLYPALARPHVEVVGDAVRAVEPTGVRTADGRLHEVDVLVWATGFAATRFLPGITVTGLGGADLHERWSHGPRAWSGLAVPDFPHLFCLYGPGTNLGGGSVLAMLEAQAAWVGRFAGHLASRRDAGSRSLLDVRPEALEADDRTRQARLARSRWAACESWYTAGGRVVTNWPGTVREYRRRLATLDLAVLREVAVAGDDDGGPPASGGPPS